MSLLNVHVAHRSHSVIIVYFGKKDRNMGRSVRTKLINSSMLPKLANHYTTQKEKKKLSIVFLFD